MPDWTAGSHNKGDRKVLECDGKPDLSCEHVAEREKGANPTVIAGEVAVSRQVVYRVKADPAKAEGLLAEWGCDYMQRSASFHRITTFVTQIGVFVGRNLPVQSPRNCRVALYNESGNASVRAGRCTASNAPAGYLGNARARNKPQAGVRRAT